MNISRYILLVRNISWTTSNCELQKYFETFGNVKFARVKFNNAGISTGLGIVEFYYKDDMVRALNVRHTLHQNTLCVERNHDTVKIANSIIMPFYNHTDY